MKDKGIKGTVRWKSEKFLKNKKLKHLQKQCLHITFVHGSEINIYYRKNTQAYDLTSAPGYLLKARKDGIRRKESSPEL